MPDATGNWILYYRNVARDIVGIWSGDYAALRQLEIEIRCIDPGNYLCLHHLPLVTAATLDQHKADVLQQMTSHAVDHTVAEPLSQI